MQKELQELKSKICVIKEPIQLTEEEWSKIKNKTTVVLMAGGESSRFQSITAGLNVNKNSFELPNGDTMIEMTLRMYKNAGITDFVALLYHHGESVEKLLEDGSKYGVNIKYSYDPGKPVGKGGAVKQAYECGALQDDRYYIVHNPDDIVLGFEEEFVKHVMSGHIQGEKEGAKCTVVVVEETPYAFTGMEVQNGFVTDIEMYPSIPIPTHIGATIFSPGLKDMFDKNFDYNVKADFEKVLFPQFGEKKELYSVSIPSETWIAVNTPKAYKTLLKKLDLDK